jgi:FkbM family methyltransferase
MSEALFDYASTPHAQMYHFLHDQDIRTIVEVGARDGLGTVILATLFPVATVYSYECNPALTEGCRRVIASAPCKDRVVFHDYGLGRVKERRTFYPYLDSDGGPSSFLQRVDFEKTQAAIEHVQLDMLANDIGRYAIERIDLLFMDVQGYELNVLLGTGDEYLKNSVRFILLEIPREEINRSILSRGHSAYVGAPTRQEILDYLRPLGFEIIATLYENELEENVLLANVACCEEQSQ